MVGAAKQLNLVLSVALSVGAALVMAWCAPPVVALSPPGLSQFALLSAWRWPAVWW